MLFVTGRVAALEFSINSRFLAVAGDKHVAVFHNVSGYRSTIAELEQKKKSATTAAMRERLQAQINEAKLVQVLHFSQCYGIPTVKHYILAASWFGDFEV